MNTKGLVLATVAAVAVCLNVSAIPIFPGGFEIYPGPEPAPIGAAVVAQITMPFAGADIQGEVISTVLTGDLLNPFGGLTFTYEINVDQAAGHPLGSFSVGNYGPYLTDMSWSPDLNPLGVAPTYMDRSLLGEVLHYDFSMLGGPGIWGGESSALMVVRTDALFYQPTIASVINSGSAEVNSFAPIAVPEPASAGLIALVSGGALFIRRRFMI